MCHYNSVFHQLLKHVPWEEFDALVMEHRADARVRRLTTKSQFLAMLYGQLAGAANLREIVGGIRSQRARLYHLGARFRGARPWRTPTATGRPNSSPRSAR
jgi:Domain of unknown function (DUF4372)